MEDFQKATEDIVTKVRHIQEMSKRYNEALQVKFINFIFPIFIFTFFNTSKKKWRGFRNWFLNDFFLHLIIQRRECACL